MISKKSHAYLKRLNLSRPKFRHAVLIRFDSLELNSLFRNGFPSASKYPLFIKHSIKSTHSGQGCEIWTVDNSPFFGTSWSDMSSDSEAGRANDPFAGFEDWSSSTSFKMKSSFESGARVFAILWKREIGEEIFKPLRWLFRLGLKHAWQFRNIFFYFQKRLQDHWIGRKARILLSLSTVEHAGSVWSREDLVWFNGGERILIDGRRVKERRNKILFSGLVRVERKGRKIKKNWFCLPQI